MSVEVRQPKATVSGALEGVLGSAQLRIGINMIPIAEVSLFPKVDAMQQAKEPSTGEVADVLGQWQSHIFAKRPEPDATVTMDDGNGGIINMSGYVADPSLAFGPGYVDQPMTIVHESGVVGGLNPSIYSFMSNTFLVPSVTADDFNVDTPLAGLLRSLTEELVKTWKTNKSNFTLGSAPERAIRDEVSEVNDKLLPVWYAILDNSSYDLDWSEIHDLDPNYRKTNLNTWIYQMLWSGEGNFMQTLMALTSGFQGLFVPDLAPKKYGRLCRYDQAFEDARDLDLPSENMRLNAGSFDLLPMTHVIVTTAAKNFWMYGSGGGNQNIPRVIVGGWPPTTYEGAGLLRDSGPPWLGQVLLPSPVGGFPEDRLDLSLYQQKKTAADKDAYEKVARPCAKICERWARNLYRMESLRTARVSVTVPIDLKLEVGRYYSVKSGGVQLFKGLLAEASHIIATHPSPSAMSHLTFSHTEAGSFTLPNA